METRMLIGGELVKGSGPPLDVLNPADETTVATVPTAAPEQVDAAITAAREAAPGWGGMPAGDRAELLHEIAARLRARTDELGELMTREGGKPLIENTDEVSWTANAFQFYAETARASAGRVIPPVESSQMALVLKEPLGVVACIVPWYRGVRRAHAEPAHRRPARAGNRRGSHGQRAAARQGPRPRRGCGRRGRQGPRRRRDRRPRPRLLLRAGGRHRRAGRDGPAA